MKTLLIHGSGACGAVWSSLPDLLEGSEAIDLPGHDQGEPLPTVEQYAAWVKYSWAKDEPLVLVGHSLGGAIALTFALKWPGHLAGIVLVGSGARLKVNPTLLEGLAEPDRADATLMQLLDRLHRCVEPELAKRLVDASLSIGANVMLNDLRACNEFNLLDRVGELSVPLLAICGEDDEMTPPKYSEFLGDQVPDGEAVVVPNGTHLLPAENPASLGALINPFLNRLRARSVS